MLGTTQKAWQNTFLDATTTAHQLPAPLPHELMRNGTPRHQSTWLNVCAPVATHNTVRCKPSEAYGQLPTRAADGRVGPTCNLAW